MVNFVIMKKLYKQPQTDFLNTAACVILSGSGSEQGNVNSNPESGIWGNAPTRRAGILYI